MLLQFFKRSSFLLFSGATLFLISCNGEETKSNDTRTTPTESLKDTPEISPKVNTTESGNSNGDGPIKIKNDASENSATKENNTEVKLNPPHGQPGHSCDIAVGDPLPSSIGSPEKNNTINSPTNTVKLNPPHGQPGHKCEIPVGEPLN